MFSMHLVLLNLSIRLQILPENMIYDRIIELQKKVEKYYLSKVRATNVQIKNDDEKKIDQILYLCLLKQIEQVRRVKGYVYK